MSGEEPSSPGFFIGIVITVSFACGVLFGHLFTQPSAVDSLQIKANPIGHKDGGFWLDRDEVERILRLYEVAEKQQQREFHVHNGNLPDHRLHRK